MLNFQMCLLKLAAYYRQLSVNNQALVMRNLWR